MLSKIAAILLGVFSEKELSAYELTKLLEEYETTNYFPIGDSSVYATVKKLEMKEYIEGRIIQGDKSPSKTKFKITEKGKAELDKTISQYLDKLIKNGGEFEIGILLLNRLKKDEIMKKLKNKLHQLEKTYYDLKRIILRLEQNRSNVSFTTIAVLKHRRHIVEAERKTVNELIKLMNIQQGRRSAKNFYDLRIQT